MDKMEYKNLIAEMQNLVKQKKFADVITVADTINWHKVNNINELVIGAEAYESAGENAEAKELLLLAHERSPIGRMILYKLCMLSIKIGDLEEAQEYYNEFVQIAPHDTLKHILKYQINVAKGSDNATLIKILEQLKETEFIEEWAYELAYLYHKTNQADKCIALCDEIILWFGDGPVVERSLELKMLYQPLDKTQEDKYRNLQQKKDGLTEIKANEPLMSGEIVPRTITIPSVQPPADRFNTINLQAEIKKNIDEIMKATEKGVVNENIDAIKNLVEEIPYLQVQDIPEEKVEEKESFSINDTFNAYLEEGFDGQMSLRLPDESKESDEQVEGQMTIQDVMAEWERTKHAAEAALKEAKEKELEYARAKALREATTVLNRLEGAMSKMQAGMTSSDLLKEEYLSSPSEEIKIDTVIVDDTEHVVGEIAEKGFAIPKVDSDGTNIGSIDIPIVRPAVDINIAAPIEPIISKEVTEEETTTWQPPTLETDGESEDVDYKEASQLIADVNKMLQQEIDKLSDDEGEGEQNAVGTTPTIEFTVQAEPLVSETNEETPADKKIFEAESPKIEDIELPLIQMPDDLFNDETKPQVERVTLEEEPAQETREELPVIADPVFEPDEVAQLVNEDVLTKAIKNEVPKMSDEDLSAFSYFLPIKGMKNSITQVLAGAIHHLENPSTNGGNIIIVGDKGCGKTQMATDIVSVLQKKTGKPAGGIGKISGNKLNEKDIQKLYAKIQGGCLIIEDAGEITKETAVTFSLLMEQDKQGTMVILEDTHRGIEKVLRLDASFAKRFTEKITIPTFSIDELVTFGKTYSEEKGYTIDEMGILALYNRINALTRYDHATTINEVVDIIESAMKKSAKGGFFNKAKTDKEGHIILREKDFEN